MAAVAVLTHHLILVVVSNSTAAEVNRVERSSRCFLSECLYCCFLSECLYSISISSYVKKHIE